MRAETIWYADDDTEFYSEEECRAYEEQCKADFNSVLFFDENGKPNEKPVLNWIESESMYIYIKDADAAERLFAWLYEQCSFYAPEVEIKTGHVLAWNCGDDSWHDMTVELEDMKLKMAEIMRSV